MPRPRRPGAPEPKRRSRKGCWPCKARKVKCGEEKPSCLNCQRQGEDCDYSVRLNWGGRTKRSSVDSPNSQSSGHGGSVISFSEPVTFNTTSSAQLPTSVTSIPADVGQPATFASPGAISPGTTASVGIFESPKPPSGSDVTSPSQLELQFTTWPEQSSPLTTSTSSEPLSHYPFGQHAFDSVSYTAPADQGSNLRSFSVFNLQPSSVSQPVSFLRGSLEESSHPPGSPTFQNDNNQFAGDVQISDFEHGTGYHMPERGGTSQNSPAAGELASLLSSPHGISMPETSTSSPSAHGLTPTILASSYDRHRGSIHNSRAPSRNEQAADNSSVAQNKWKAYLTSVTDNYGLDSGRPDRDLSFNNDHAAIDINNALDLTSSRWRSEDAGSSPQPFSHNPDCSGYYVSPVPVNIPRYLSPLPSTLLENPINLMYFHHFINHTSRMLVPHDCEDNPFMSVLPSMAIGDPNLLNLLLAYSASHRARYLGHPEPANRIAHWVSDVFPSLRMALEVSNEDITDSHLATAIMLVSLKIVSPGTFEVPITWQSHLKLARGLFMARSERIARPGNRIGAFFARWLGYIDTVGALSCRQAGPPLMLYQSVLRTCCSPDQYDEFQVDCFTGFTPRTGVFLLRLAQLVQQCDNQRFDEMGNFCRNWHPSADIVMEAHAVLGDFEDLGERAHDNPHHHLGVEALEMMATQEAFRCAGLLHLHRRVLGSPSDSFAVKEALRKLVAALGRMRPGASTEVCSLLPIFTAGCESQDFTQRTKLLDRFMVLEKSGLKQIQDARQLMQRCWKEKLPWVALAEGQFLG
ncbi:hypothetical protein N7474_006051 [Penicillium riverlandense]|uniref:uncharacterized protein n=1 Tax=Penicillium riverlandense TaxID=1903569 RepID=UPI002548FE2F|nr:uncharacterized protein N7474_006051 [Penicillium riverlandense]KAJ5820460.1 hypothetical protein N7474_006051 [Penicillium riverlandense]